ncbi:MAG: hypothetical protein JSS40_02130 [Proteobacteria bacterium]|nr:hypothetical protein [Pseudomonadota bacterium]
MRPAWRLPLLAAGFVSLAFGVAAGLARLGWDIRLPGSALAVLHGPLMACAFFGTVISLERAVALGAGWGYLGPLASGAGGLAMVAGAHTPAVILLAAGSAVFVAASCVLLKRQPLLHNACLVIGAAGWLAGTLLLATGEPVFAVSPWWMGFLVLTIAGERLELSRFMRPSPAAQRIFMVVMACLAVAPAIGWWAIGASLLALSLWLAWKDVALRTIRGKGLTRYIAGCLLAGYAWMAIGALVMLSGTDMQPGRLAYDAALHAVFLGFVFSMVFGHAPIIAPALFRIRLPYHPFFYVPLVLLHATVALRVAADFLVLPPWRAVAGAGNAAAIAVFIITMLVAVLRGRRAGSRPPAI